jgi:hypothetical protein
VVAAVEMQLRFRKTSCDYLLHGVTSPDYRGVYLGRSARVFRRDWMLQGIEL